MGSKESNYGNPLIFNMNLGEAPQFHCRGFQPKPTPMADLSFHRRKNRNTSLIRTAGF